MHYISDKLNQAEVFQQCLTVMFSIDVDLIGKKTQCGSFHWIALWVSTLLLILSCQNNLLAYFRRPSLLQTSLLEFRVSL